MSIDCMSIEDVLKALALGPPKPFKQHVWVRPDEGIVEIALEDVACYHEWIEGEAAFMSIWRAMDDKRVVGATLPLRNWKGALPVHIDDQTEAPHNPISTTQKCGAVNSVDERLIIHPLSVAQAQHLGVCRFCRQPESVSPGNPFILNFGHEFAHKSCIDLVTKRG